MACDKQSMDNITCLTVLFNTNHTNANLTNNYMNNPTNNYTGKNGNDSENIGKFERRVYSNQFGSSNSHNGKSSGQLKLNTSLVDKP